MSFPFLGNKNLKSELSIHSVFSSVSSDAQNKLQWVSTPTVCLHMIIDTAHPSLIYCLASEV